MGWTWVLIGLEMGLRWVWNPFDIILKSVSDGFGMGLGYHPAFVMGSFQDSCGKFLV